MNKQIVYEKLKRARLQRFITNCYSMDVLESVSQIWEIGDNFIFPYYDHGVTRLIYAAQNWETVNELINRLNKGQYYLEYMTKERNEFVPNHSLFTARMLRLSNPNCRSVFELDSSVLQFRDKTIGVWAQEEDAEEINRILWSVFHPEISHLLNDEELRAKIRDKQITINKEAEYISALLQAEVMPKKFYINQIVNKGERKTIHAILLNRLEEYINAGGKYLYAWVDENNIPSLKFHQKYGMVEDGTYSEIYCIER